MHRALELGRRADVLARTAEVGVALESLGGDDVPQQPDDLLALGGHLHLGDRVEQQVPTILRAGRPEVVDRAVTEGLHRDQPSVGVHKRPAHVREVGDPPAVQDAVVGMGDRLVHGMLAHADGGEPDVELADVHRVQRGIEGRLPGVQHILRPHWVVLQTELGHEHLGLDDVLDQPVVLVLAVRREEHVPVRTGHVRPSAEHRDHAGHIAVPDVVLLAGGPETARSIRGQHHVGGVDVGPVLALRQPEREHRTVLEPLRRAAAGCGVLALPDRPQTQDGDLPGVPVVQAVKGQDLTERRDPAGVPALVGVAVRLARRRAHRREQPLLGDELQEVAVPAALAVVLEQLFLAPLLEPVDRRPEQPSGLVVEMGRVVGVRIEQQRPGATGLLSRVDLA